MNTPVSFPLAKLLKEKGFDVPTNKYHEHALTSKKDSETNDYTGAFGWKKGETNLQDGYCKNNHGMSDFSNENWYMCSAPTISDVVMWLYKKYNIWISVDPEIDTNTWFHTITHGKSISAFGNYSSPIEAYEKGIEHILNDMI